MASSESRRRGQPTVEIEDRGRGGSITYVERGKRIAFDWEFAMPPTLALIWGPKAAAWDTEFPWAAGRQREIYAFVGEEVLRQKTDDCHVVYDLDLGTMDIRYGRPPKSEQLERFMESLPATWEAFDEDEDFDRDALTALSTEDREKAVEIIARRDATWREVDALATLDTPAAWQQIEQALHHHLSIDTRLSAAAALKRRDPAFDLESVLTRQIRELHDPARGLDRALALAEASPTPAVKQALLYASYNSTECARPCATLLLRLSGIPTSPLEPDMDAALKGLGLHVSYFELQRGFAALCQRLGMTLET